MSSNVNAATRHRNPKRLSLTEIAYQVGCDKGDHGYCLVYEPLFAPIRERESVEVLEIGLAAGGPELGGDMDREIENAPSVELWLAYFDDAHVTGFDISDFSSLAGPRFSFVRGDSGSVQDLDKLKRLGKQFDIIIDDASHASYHQQLMLAELFELVRPGGLYIIEDLNWIPPSYEEDLPPVPRTRDVLVDFLKGEGISCSPAINNKAAGYLMSEICTVLVFDSGYLNALRRNFASRFNVKYQANALGAEWRNKNALARVLDPYFWRFATRVLMYSLSSEEFCSRHYIQLSIIQKVG